MSQYLRAFSHQDGEWDVSMSDIDGEELSWAENITLETEDGTKITLQRNGRLTVEGDFEVVSITE